MGGKSPCLIFSDADVKKAAAEVASGICYNTGQSCGALSRVFVPRDLLPAVSELMRDALSQIKLGYGLDDPGMGPLVSTSQLERVTGFIRSGAEEGARLYYGGKHPDEGVLGKGYYIEPTIFLDARPGMKIVDEEIFGPVLCLMPFDTEEEAVSLANNSKYGLSAEIWTTDLSRAHRVAAQLDASHVTVNGGGGFGVEAPFGGIKHSGFGREGGWESILQYSRVKNVWINL
jgi:acyl-CoA reductase-like NAD-dependent aldehyde dehydrogenase